MDYTLLHADTGILLLLTVKTNNFTSEKVRLTSGKLQKMPFLGIQSYHLRSAKIVPFLRNLDFCTQNLVSDGNLGKPPPQKTVKFGKVFQNVGGWGG